MWGNVQEQQTQAVVLQQPKDQKVYLDVQHSTDTIAILSFALSIIIALILGSLATWLAYWYGRKSFKLTEMSFKTVVEQIKSSETTALDLNSKLFNQQLVLQDREKKNLQKVQWIDSFRLLAQSYMSKNIELLFKLDRFQEKYLHFPKNVKIDDKTEAGKCLDQISLLIEESVILTSHIALFLESYALTDNKIIHFSDFFNQTAQDTKKEYLNISSKEALTKYKKTGIVRDTDEISKELYSDSNEHINSLENKDRLGVLGVYSRMIGEEFKIIINEKAA